MYLCMKRTALSLCLLATLSTPAWANGSTPATDVHLISAPAPSVRFDQVPSAVKVDGKTLKFDQAPIMVDGMLMVPLRAIAEAAGGEVTWDSGIQLIHVRMPERTILVRLGHLEAEMHQDGVSYLTRNLILMNKLPALVGGRTLVSADALTTIFGFQGHTGADGSLELTSPGTPPVSLGDSSERGTISQVEAGDQPRILLSGAAMGNGEPRLTWATITEKTKINIQEGAQTRPGSVSDLKVGSQVDVTWAGPLRLSYPAVGDAAEIVVHK